MRGRRVADHAGTAAVCWGLLAAAAWAGDGSSSPRSGGGRFPIGIYGVDDPTALPGLASAGFDSFVASCGDAGSLRRLAAEARTLKMRMIVNSGVAGALRRGDVPLEAWYLHDEPENHGVSPGRLEEEAQRVAATDPGGLRAFSIGRGSAAAAFGRIGDVIMLDWYPVPHLRLDSVADQLDEARRSLPAGKPIWMILQAMDWSDYPQRDPAKPRIGRFPTFGELRLMSYLALVHDASGLFYFTYRNPAGRTLPEDAAAWSTLTRVTSELRSLKPTLERGRVVPLPFPPSPDGIEARAWRAGARMTVVAVNRKADAYQRVPEALLEGRWRPLFETRRDPRELLRRIGDAWYLPPHRVLVLERGCGLAALIGRCP